MDDLELRSVIYRHIADTGAVPLRDELQEFSTELDDQLRRLHDGHMIVLDDREHRRGEIRMALPFSAEPTNFRVETANGAWFANCAWDSLAVVAAVKENAHIRSTWADDGAPLELAIADGRLDATDGSIYFKIPAARWWYDIVET